MGEALNKYKLREIDFITIDNDSQLQLVIPLIDKGI